MSTAHGKVYLLRPASHTDFRKIVYRRSVINLHFCVNGIAVFWEANQASEILSDSEEIKSADGLCKRTTRSFSICEDEKKGGN